MFAAYGDDAEAALRNWQQIDQRGYDEWAGTLEVRQYLRDFQAWSRKQRVSVAPLPGSDEPTLFPAPAAQTVRTRATVVHDGSTADLLDLAGIEGASLLRQAALRDLGPAESTTRRCRFHLALAELVEAETVKQGRPVAVSEVIGLVAA